MELVTFVELPLTPLLTPSAKQLLQCKILILSLNPLAFLASFTEYKVG